MIATKTKSSSSVAEFIIIISMMMALTALSIDAMLPALPQIGNDLGIVNPNDRQLIISVIFLGQALGQLFFGPLSDKTGRRQAIFAGYALFIAGALLAALSTSFPIMLLGRIMQGIGVSAPRAVSTAMIRDLFEGRRMARIMSFAMAVFILIPMVAPSIGQGLMLIGGWRSIFGSFLLFALITVLWFGLRIPETLPLERRHPFSFQRISTSIVETLKIRAALGFTLTGGLVLGVFVGYLNSSQQIFQDQYGLGEQFPLFFAANALSMGLASFLNARFVMRYGMLKMVQWALAAIFGAALIFLAPAILFAGTPPLWLLMVFFLVAFFCIGILFANVNSLAMEPLGHMAGLGAAVVGSISTLISMVLGIVIGGSYNGTILPLLLGMVLLMGLANGVVRWTVASQTPAS
ncbi:MAG: multidrug effflux MFS transporter [Anaerolineae bacterium]